MPVALMRIGTLECPFVDRGHGCRDELASRIIGRRVHVLEF